MGRGRDMGRGDQRVGWNEGGRTLGRGVPGGYKTKVVYFRGFGWGGWRGGMGG